MASMFKFKPLVRRGTALLLVLLVVAAGVLKVRAYAPDWATVNEAGQQSWRAWIGNHSASTPLDQANFCESTWGIPTEISPSWVGISGDTNPTNPDRAYVKANGQVLYGPTTAEGKGRGNPFVHETDQPVNHWSHDIDVFLTLDKDSRPLMADGNFSMDSALYQPNEWATFEIESENAGVPLFAFPTPGDRMTVWGNEIWDCGHGGPDKFHAEIHPPAGWVVYRQTASKTETPEVVPETGINKKDEDPWQWYESTDLQGIGTTLPHTALGNTSVQATVADVFFSSYGGRAIRNLNGCNLLDKSACYWREVGPKLPNAWEWLNLVLQQDYSFFIPAPPKPQGTPDAVLVIDQENRCNELLPNPGNRSTSDPINGIEEHMGYAVSGDSGYNIGSATCANGQGQTIIPDQVDPVFDANGQQTGFNVTVKAHSSGVAYPANYYIGYAKRFKVAWDYVPAAAQRVHTFKVDFQQLIVRNNTVAECLAAGLGQWLLQLRVNENWIWPVQGSGEGGKSFWQDSAINDGRVCVGSNHPPATYPIGASLQASVVPGQYLNVWEWGWSYHAAPADNDILPAINEYHQSDNTAPGTYQAGAPLDPGITGSHNITYTISDVTPPMPTNGTLIISDPKYGPNADTGGLFDGATRVAANTLMTLTNSNAKSLQFRYWLDGQAPQENWHTDSVGPLQITFAPNDSDGTYIVEYAPISPQGIVGERQRQRIQLDRTPPTLTVPSTMHVPATSATGAPVTWSLPAYPTDNFPGPITTACNQPTTLPMVLIGHPVTVTCTATDAVGNATTKSFKIFVDPPFGYLHDFVFLGQNWVRAGAYGTIKSGNVGANQSSSAAPQTPGGATGVEVQIGDYTKQLPPPIPPRGGPPPLAAIAGEDILLGTQTQVGNAFPIAPSRLTAGVGATYVLKPGFVPLFPSMPVFPFANANGNDLTVPVNTTLMPGNYGNVTLGPGVQANMIPGDYSFKSLTLQTGSLGSAQLLFTGATTLHITGQLVIQDGGKVIPATGSAVKAHQVIFYVGGADSLTSGGAKVPAVRIGNLVQINANIYAPNGTLAIGMNAKLTGAFIAQGVDVGDRFTATLDSALDIVYP